MLTQASNLNQHLKLLMKMEIEFKYQIRSHCKETLQMNQVVDHLELSNNSLMQ